MAFICIDNGPAKGERITLSGMKEYVGGRDSKAFIELDDRLVSRRHFRIRATPKLYVLEDLESANGTFLNGIRIAQKRRLSAGDRIQIGETRLTFLTDEIEDNLIGKSISGFEVLECVGRGGMGTVYKARQLSLDRFVALKVLSNHLVSDARFAEAFHREARAAGQINHPSIVQVYDVDTVQVDGEDVTFFAMEYMPGGSVEDLINKEKQLGVERALEIVLDVSRGLQFAEKNGLVHRDIKPGNLMIGDIGEVKIVDLGIARQAESGSKASQEDGVSGSPHYISPEQARGRDLDSGADMYSLGISLYHMLAGRPPFLAATAKELLVKHIKLTPPPIADFRQGLPELVENLMNRLIKKERDERFADGSELVAHVDAILRSVRGETMPTEGMSPQARRWAILSSIIFVLIVIGAIAGGFYANYRDQGLRDETARSQDYESTLQRIELLLDDARIEIEDSRFSDAEAFLDRADQLVDSNPDVLTAHPDLEAEIAETRESLVDSRRLIVQAGYHRRAEDALSQLLESVPIDLSASRDLQALAKWNQRLEAFVQEYPNTPAAREAREHLDTIEESTRRTREQYREAETALERVTRRSETLLQFDPPGYREAATAVKSFLSTHENTPAGERGKTLLSGILRDMKIAAEEAVKEAEKLVAENQRPKALRSLQRLQAEVDGEAAALLKAAITRLQN